MERPNHGSMNVLIDRAVDLLKAFQVLIVRNSVGPMSGHHRHTGHRNKDSRDKEAEYPIRDRCFRKACLHKKRLFHRAYFNASKTARAFVAPNPSRGVNFDICRARFGAQLAIDARRCVAGDLERAEPTDDTKQRAVWTKESAPEILDHN